MMHDKDLIRRALMGDKQAQKECTEKGIVLPCPICRGKIEQSLTGNRFMCKRCGFVFYAPISGNYGADEYINLVHRFNTRPAPPVGRCEDCKWYVVKKPKCCGYCKLIQTTFGCEEFCSYFEPKED